MKTNNKGAAAIEMAIAAPVLFLLLMGIVEIGLMLFASCVVEGATAIGARIDNVSAIPGGLSRDAYIRSQIGQLSSGFLQPALPSITAQPMGNSVTLYRVTYPWAVTTPMIRQIFGDANGNFDITAAAAVRDGQF
ncbi:MAG: pilus assembly protein [Pseudomonadota bacterium]|nr:pilus assembly protein [Pseudomonadota bacterium]